MIPTLRDRLEAYLKAHGWTKHIDKGPMPMYSKTAAPPSSAPPGYSKETREFLYFAEAVLAQCEEEERKP
jgi:hypothetical protein